MSDCCSIQAPNDNKKKILWIVLWLNLIMFVVQVSAAIIGHSSSLFADSMDMFGDFITYAASIIAIGKSDKWLVAVSKFKAYIIMLFAGIVVIEVIFKLLYPLEPSVAIMAYFSLIAMVVNLICFILLSKEKDTDINMHSTWICSRNDLIGNFLVLVAAGLVYLFASKWPDIVIGFCFSVYLFYSARLILSKAKPSNVDVAG